MSLFIARKRTLLQRKFKLNLFLNGRHYDCFEDNKRYFGLENSQFNFTVSLVLHFHLDSSDDSDNYLENLTACELQNKSNCQSKK